MSLNITSCIVASSSVLVFIGIIILIVSFQYVEYDEYVFKKYNLNNKVDMNQVFENGRYLWGPDHSKISFPRNYQRVDFNELSIADSDGKELYLELSFYYRVQKQNLNKLYNQYGNNIHLTVKSKTESVLKNTAPLYSTEEYLTKRDEIATIMNKNVTETLEKMWLDVETNKLSLKRVQVSENVEEKYLEAAIKVEQEEQTIYQGQADQIRAATNQLVAEYSVNNSLIYASAVAEATRIKSDATANSDLLVRTARGMGMSSIITNLGMTNETTRKLFFKLMAILDNSDLKIINTDNNVILNP